MIEITTPGKGLGHTWLCVGDWLIDPKRPIPRVIKTFSHGNLLRLIDTSPGQFTDIFEPDQLFTNRDCGMSCKVMAWPDVTWRDMSVSWLSSVIMTTPNRPRSFVTSEWGPTDAGAVGEGSKRWQPEHHSLPQQAHQCRDWYCRRSEVGQVTVWFARERSLFLPI